jgi:hypothetical protein
MRIALRLKQLGERRVAANSEAGFVVLVALLLELAARAVQPTGAASSQHAAARGRQHRRQQQQQDRVRSYGRLHATRGAVRLAVKHV